MDDERPSTGDDARLTVLKALADNTRYAIYRELVRAGQPRTTAEIAEQAGLHPNTVRPHLERMRDAGLLVVETESTGSVGRPQHRYSVAPGAPDLSFDPPRWSLLAHLLADVAAFMVPDADDVAAMAWEQGRQAAGRHRAPSCAAALTSALAELGYDPVASVDGRTTTIAFTACPYRELAEVYPELVCNLHRGLVEGFVEQAGGARVEAFATLADRDPCHVELSRS